MNRLLREFRVEATVGRPRVAYRETLTRVADAEGRFEGRVGGRPCSGRVALRVEPSDPGKPWAFEDGSDPSVLPRALAQAAEKGVREAVDRGLGGGCPVTGVRVTLLGGWDAQGETPEVAFKMAAAEAFREAARKAGPRRVEPVMALEVVTPEEFLGDVIGDLKARKGRVVSSDQRAGARLVAAEAPLAALFGYATHLRSRSQGRATFSMRFSHYREATDDGAPGE